MVVEQNYAIFLVLMGQVQSNNVGIIVILKITI